MNREEALKTAQTGDGWFFLESGKEFRGDKEIMMEAVKTNHHLIGKVHKKLLKDKEFMMVAVQSNAYSLDRASDDLKKDPELVLEAVKSHAYAIQYADPSLYSNKEIMLQAVYRCGETLKFASEGLKNDKEVVETALQYRNGDYQNEYKYASEELKCDKEIIRRHLANGGDFHLIPYKVYCEVMKNRDLAKTSLKHDESNYTRFDSSLYHDKELIKEIASINPSILSKITHFNDDKEVIMAGIDYRGSSLSYASERLKNDPELVLAAVKGSFSAGTYVGDALYEQLKSVTPHEPNERKEKIVQDAIPYLEDLVKAQKFSEKLDSELSQKPLTKAQQLSNDIEAEDFVYKPATTRTARTKL